MLKIAIRFGLLAVAFVLLLQLSKYTWLSYRVDTEMVILLMGAVFISLGYFISRSLIKPKSVDTGHPFELDEQAREKTGISDREMDVLILMAEGKSNQEIAEQLFVSGNTIKTHVSNIFLKLEAKRRTEAIRKAKELRLIP